MDSLKLKKEWLDGTSKENYRAVIEKLKDELRAAELRDASWIELNSLYQGIAIYTEELALDEVKTRFAYQGRREDNDVKG